MPRDTGRPVSRSSGILMRPYRLAACFCAVFGMGSSVAPAHAQILDFGERDLFLKYRVRLQDTTPDSLVQKAVAGERMTTIHMAFYKRFGRLPTKEETRDEVLPADILKAGEQAAAEVQQKYDRRKLAEGQLLLVVHDGNVLYDLTDTTPSELISSKGLKGYDPLGGYRVIYLRDAGEYVVKGKRENRYKITDVMPSTFLGPMPLLPFSIGEGTIGTDFRRQPDGTFTGKLVIFGMSGPPFVDAHVFGRIDGTTLSASHIHYSRHGLTYAKYRVESFKTVNGIAVPSRIRRTMYRYVTDKKSVPGRMYTIELQEAGSDVSPYVSLFDWRSQIKGRTIIEEVTKNRKTTYSSLNPQNLDQERQRALIRQRAVKP